MIYTLTLNPSIDYIVSVDALTFGQVNRMTKDLKLPGGKGINVSRILNTIGVPSTALGFLGGFTGQFIQDWLDQEGIATRFTPIQTDTRINIKLKTETETEINGQGPFIANEAQQQLKEQLAFVQPNDIVVLSGSLPPGLSEQFYLTLIPLILAKKAQFVIDTTGNALLDALASQPLLVKPNLQELAALFQTSFATSADVLAYGKRLLTLGAQHAIVSMAEQGAFFFTPTRIYHAPALNYPVKNSVGAGDSMIAGFIGAYAQQQTPVEAFRWGVACGSATAFSDDLASKEWIENMLAQVVIVPIEGSETNENH